ncbi:hypothetical protein TRFO_26733 [Tritrichomonas foetus]|uniref:BAR domain-containing protein n=1 Tax=Tritrichomonas foetus TaxID=1144522 RepID=A0A1J4K7W9_9EUKA|nr:hypothetical protein TRFO_26733 [Tritrichomonas foetus]|eukprot:OHT05525.1 hypothetical protein TRFO_26733 [Tritrichomonas foetus]
MNDHVEFLNLSPLHLNSLSVRMKEMTQLKEHINATSKTFQAYSEVGAQLCSCMSKLSASFQDYQEFQSDPALKAISDLLNKFQSSLKIHYEQIQDHIITPLKEYVKNDITSVEEKGKEATKAIDAYFKTVENYTMISKKKPQNELDEADVRLKKCHKKACFSDYLFMRSLDLVERRKLIEVLAHVCIF